MLLWCMHIYEHVNDNGILLFCITYSLHQEDTEWCNTCRKPVRCHQIDQTHANKDLRPVWCGSCTGFSTSSIGGAGGAAPNTLVRRGASGQQKQSTELELFSCMAMECAWRNRTKWDLITIEPIHLSTLHGYVAEGAYRVSDTYPIRIRVRYAPDTYLRSI